MSPKDYIYHGFIGDYTLTIVEPRPRDIEFIIKEWTIDEDGNNHEVLNEIKINMTARDLSLIQKQLNKYFREISGCFNCIYFNKDKQVCNLGIDTVQESECAEWDPLLYH